MSVIVDIDHEAGDLTEYSSTVTDSGDLSAAAAAALAGTGYGLQAVIDDTTAIYGQANFNTAAILRYRFYFDPNTLTMANNDYFRMLSHIQNGGSNLTVVILFLNYATATGYSTSIEAYNDDGTLVFSDSTTITDAPHYIEVNCVRAATSSSSDGSYEWWVDGVNKGSGTSIDNYNLIADQNQRVRLGPGGGIDAGTSGTLYFDQLVVNNDGSEIGAYSAGIKIPVLLAQYRQRRQ